MKRSAQRALGKMLCLLLAASTLDTANAAISKKGKIQNISKKEEDQDRQIGQNQSDIMALEEKAGGLRIRTEQLERAEQVLAGQLAEQIRAQAKEASDTERDLSVHLKTIENQVAILRSEQERFSRKNEGDKLLSYVEVALTSLLAAGALLLGLVQRRTLRNLVRERRETPKTEDGVAAPPLPPPPLSRHQAVAELLDQLRKEAPRLAAGFGDPSLRERFLGEYDAPLSAMLERLRISEQAEDPLEESWLGPDLVPTLNGLARFYSESVAEGRQGHAAGKELAGELRAWLYDRFSSACIAESWFAIDPIEPYVTGFDPQVHHAVAGCDIDGAMGKIIAIQEIGRRDPQSGDVIHKAEVIVGH